VASAPELNYALDVDAQPLDRRMNSGNRQIARSAARRGLEFRALRPDERAEAFAVNAENRAKRGHPLTMTLDAFLAMEHAFPDRVLWFGVFHAGRMIAANVSLLVSPDVLYVFYWGEVRGVEKLSPVTVLADGIYRECQRRGVRLLDIGIATVDGAPNHGLVAYKRNLGCTASLKLTLTKELV
jgi:predicted N-acyltransferase